MNFATSSPAHGARPFDDLAESYDAAFTDGLLGGLFRSAVRRRLDAAFQPGDRVVDLGCGTGEDALHLAARGVEVVAVDASPRMVTVARAKAERHEAGDAVDVRELAIEDLGRLGAEGPFDGALSNFGALNVVEDLSSVGRDLAAIVRPGGRVLLCVMGPLVPWEWAWYLLSGRPGTAFRRLRPGGAEWRGLRVRYPTVGALRRAFGPGFRFRGAWALGALVPPPYAEAWAGRHPRLVRALDAMERRLERVPPLPWLADHHVTELERR